MATRESEEGRRVVRMLLEQILVVTRSFLDLRIAEQIVGQQQARLIRLWIQLHRLASIFDRFADVAHGEVDLCPQDQGTHCRGPRFEPELQSSDGAVELVALQIKG